MTRSRRCFTALLTSVLVSLVAAAGASAQTPEVLYGADGAQGNPSNLYELDPATGAVVDTIGPIGFPVTGLAVDPDTGTLYGVTSRGSGPGRPSTRGGSCCGPNPGMLLTIDKTTGAGTLVGDQRPDNEAAADITFTPDGTLYGWIEPSSDDLASIDTTTGVATIVGDSDMSTSGSGLASSADGVLYFAGNTDTGPLHTIDRSTGEATEVAQLDGDTDDEIDALAFNEAGTLFGVRIVTTGTRPTELITIDPASGAITVLGPSVDRLDAIAFQPSTAAPPPPPPDYYEEACGFTIDGLDLQGDDGNDTLIGGPGRDRIRGRGGKDKIKGAADRDCLYGNKGNDKVNGDEGRDLVRGGAGNDKISGGAGNDDMRAQDGRDKVKGGSGDDKIKAQGRGRDKVNCGSGDDRVIGDVKDKISRNCEKVTIVDPR